MLFVFLNVFDELDKILDSKLLAVYSRIDKDLLHVICEFLFLFDNVGYLRSGLEYFLKGFGPVHSPTQINFSPSRSRRALSNQHHFNIKVHFHPPKNPKKPQK